MGYLNYIINANAQKYISHSIFSVYIPPDGSPGTVMVGSYSTTSVSPESSLQVIKAKSGIMTWNTNLVKVEYKNQLSI
jgi:hypothetical protein